MIRYLVSVGDGGARPKTFEPERSHVVSLEEGVAAALHVSGEGFSAETYYEAGFDRAVVQALGPSPTGFAEEVLQPGRMDALRSFDGFFAGVVVEDDVVVFRDHAGLVPLYVVDGGVRIATNMPAEAYAWASSPTPLPPGTLLKMRSNQAFQTTRLNPMEAGPETLVNNLSRCIKRLCPKTHAIFFSGGLDSLLLAKLGLDVGLEPKLFTLGVRGSSDFVRSFRAAEVLGLDVVRVEAEPVEVRKALTELEAGLGRMKPMDASISVAMRMLAARAAELGCVASVSGQGADELFGGYMKYSKALVGHGLHAVERMMMDDFSKLNEFGLPRDFLAVRSAGAYLITPYLCREVVEAALGTPLSLKLSFENGKVVRKKVLREACRVVGLGELAEVEKKALQYGTGLEKLLRRIRASG
ncbi:MAG: asparagine synthase-related protein [Candidatus Caldarchaeum sp.]|uniref:Asparagine synthetase domain-containing protein n=1 Tax=Caldiarchaeum subterraneum TaxID=311458 RepID=A0A7J3VSY0_CALS0